MLTVDEIKASLPVHLKSAATQSLTDKVNQASLDPEIARNIRENFVTYATVLRDGKFKTEDYLNAVAYVSYKLMGHTNKDAYKATFPQRYQSLVAAGRSDKEISSYIAAYNKNKLVNLIYEQSLIPAWVLNQDRYQDAINTQVELMMDVNQSGKVRAEAANSILTHLKKPESKQIDLNLGVQETSGMSELKDMLTSLAQQQQDAIAGGIPTVRVAHQDLYKKPVDVIESSAKDVTPPDSVDKVTPKQSKPEPKTNLGPNPLTSFKPA